MPRCPRGLLTAGAIALGGAVQLQPGVKKDIDRTCIAEDELTYVHALQSVCTMNWHHKVPEDKFFAHMQEGCWDLEIYNTDNFMSSGLYRNKADGRCSLVLSGYHGALQGYVKGSIDLSSPPITWGLCGNHFWAPFVKLLRHHTSLSNWTRIANFLGPGTACKGDLMVVGESAGGSMAEILAGCSNAGRMDLLQAKHLPTFPINSLYTFGSIASSARPVTNPGRPDGCFKGKRVLNSMDIVEHLGAPLMLSHAKMDTIEIFSHVGGNPTFKVHPCNEKAAAWDSIRPRPANLKTDAVFKNKTLWRRDVWSHMAPSYEQWMGFFREAGYGKMLEAEVVDVNSTEYKKLTNMHEQPAQESKADEADAPQSEPAAHEPVPRKSKSAAQASHEWMD